MTRSLTTTEIKKIAKKRFSSSPNLYYPTEIFLRYGFSRAHCGKCGVAYWRSTGSKTTCGDCHCSGYTFLERRIKSKFSEDDLTLKSTLATFTSSFTSFKIPIQSTSEPSDSESLARRHTLIDRYPVIARWRNDVDFVNAGIYCFQPYCVSGELPPPANPLICPQPCLRFNDLDNIGLTGRHYSSFFMLGIQVFNFPGNFIYFKDGIIEYCLLYLLEGLGIEKEEITFIEDVWAGGGNLGPSAEFFVGGLEIGNMVFMQYRSTEKPFEEQPGKSVLEAASEERDEALWEELSVQVIDVGIGLERIPWVLSGKPSSYLLSFPLSTESLAKTLGIDLELGKRLYAMFAEHSYKLNVDEAEDAGALDKVLDSLVDLVVSKVEKEQGLRSLLRGAGEADADNPQQKEKETKEVRKIIEGMRDLWICCDHARTLLFCLNDGALPSNEGGYANIRLVLRRLFAVLSKRLEGVAAEIKEKGSKDSVKDLSLNSKKPEEETVQIIIDLFRNIKSELEGVMEDIDLSERQLSSFRELLRVEHSRWKETDEKSLRAVKRLLEKRKAQKREFALEDWLMSVGSLGLSPDKVSELIGADVPANLYLEMSEASEKTAKKEVSRELSDALKLCGETRCMYFEEAHRYSYSFESQCELVLLGEAVFKGKPGDKDAGAMDSTVSVILSQTCFYPTSGGQLHDIGNIVFRFSREMLGEMGSLLLAYFRDSRDNKAISGFGETDMAVLAKMFVECELENTLEKHSESTVFDIFEIKDHASEGSDERKLDYLNVSFDVSEVLKINKYVSHSISFPALPLFKKRILASLVLMYSSKSPSQKPSISIKGAIEKKRRELLRKHHSAAHILYASARKVLGTHVWQSGAKKLPEEAHLDISHFRSLAVKELVAIEAEANSVISRNLKVDTYFMEKEIAEKRFGFSLYQGGVVPNKSLRIVSIEGLDVEACCGTHCSSTGEVGLLKIIRSSRISDGVVRIVFTIGGRAAHLLAEEREVLLNVSRTYNVELKGILDMTERFFQGYKSYSKRMISLGEELVAEKIEVLLKDQPAEDERVYMSINTKCNDEYFCRLSGSVLSVLRKEIGRVCEQRLCFKEFVLVDATCFFAVRRKGKAETGPSNDIIDWARKESGIKINELKDKKNSSEGVEKFLGYYDSKDPGKIESFLPKLTKVLKQQGFRKI